MVFAGYWKSVRRLAMVAATLCLVSPISLGFDSEIDIGDVTLVKRLFSYPNIGHESQTLQETVQHFLDDSIEREALGAYAVKFAVKKNRGMITFSGPNQTVVEALAQRYDSYFEIGEIGSVEYLKLRNATQGWDPQWQFLLPQGIAIENARVIEVMDFPPLTLIPKQDYLDSATTNQWWFLLGENGVTEKEKPLYSSILDIVLVAAPASHGKKLRDAGIYDGHFPKYTDAMVKLLSTNRGTSANRPLLALGFPIREWIKQRWNVDIGVNEIAVLEIEPGRFSPVIGGNHPAYYLRSKGTYGADHPTVRAILRQDLITAAWATEMGRSPEGNPTSALEAAQHKWSTDDKGAYAKILSSAGIAPPVGEEQLKKMREEEPSNAELLVLEEKFFSQHYTFEEVRVEPDALD